MAYKQKGFPRHKTKSHLKETWGEWFNKKAGQAKNFVEKGAEYASYIPGPIGSVASGIDAAIDTYDAHQAYKSGDMETYKKEKADAAANVVGIIPGAKIIQKTAKGAKALKNVSKGTQQFAEKNIKKGTGRAIKETVDTDDVKKAGDPNIKDNIA